MTSPVFIATCGGVTLAAPSSMVINDDDGTDASFTMAVGVLDAGRFRGLGSVDIAHGGSIDFSASLGGSTPNMFQVIAYSTHTGDAPTSWTWTLTETSSHGGSVISIVSGSATSEDWENATTVMIGNTGGADADFRITHGGTNAAGTTAAPNLDFTITF